MTSSLASGRPGVELFAHLSTLSTSRLLFVGSSFAPDPEQPRRFNFAFESCAVRWRKYELPLPPVGKGWGELVYLDDDFRIQQDVRGDLLVATRIR